eukprot:Nk52_evm31s238 gene=Nk52_evmTU31s238
MEANTTPKIYLFNSTTMKSPSLNYALVGISLVVILVTLSSVQGLPVPESSADPLPSPLPVNPAPVTDGATAGDKKKEINPFTQLEELLRHVGKAVEATPQEKCQQAVQDAVNDWKEKRTVTEMVEGAIAALVADAKAYSQLEDMSSEFVKGSTSCADLVRREMSKYEN